MKGKLLLLFAAICCVVAHAVAHDGDDDGRHVAVTSPDLPVAGEVVPSPIPTEADPSVPQKPPKDDAHMDMDMGIDDMGAVSHHDRPKLNGPIPPEQMSYWLWPEHRALLYAHALIMTISWGFLLPVGIMLGVAQSSFHIPVQFAFLTLTTIGVIFAIIYNSATPDFYENNAHHKIGWIIVWMLVAQVGSGLIRGVARYVNGDIQRHSLDRATDGENMFMLGGEHDDDEDDADIQEHKRRPDLGQDSSDSGNGTGESTPRGASTSSDPYVIRRSSENTLLNDHEQNFGRHSAPRSSESKIEGFLARILSGQGWLSRIGRRGAFIARVVHALLGRPLWCLGFIQLCTGVVTVTGIFKAGRIYNGLAHFIKGGIFLNYGVITLGRYCGVFADFGWAWNLRPPGELMGQKWKDRVPSGEFVESLVILVYGASQSFMEHLGNRDGGEWTHKDLQHVSIAIMFFWTGLCGVLIELTFIRRCFNRTIEATLYSRTPTYQMIRDSGSYSNRQINPALKPPIQQGFSYNPFPGLIIFMTGIMMSMHHQESMLSTMIHKQWGYLLAGFALFRLGTYFLMFLNPPTSYIPSRPLTELLASFCLICGGMVFMASNADTVEALEMKDIDPMFVFNLSVAASTLIMAWIMIVMAIKGWAVYRRR